jgi:hypothetical protein
VITDDEVLQLFARADPARVSDVEPKVDAAAYLDALRTRSTDMTLVENPPRRSDGKPRTPRWLLISAAAAVVVIVLGALVVADRDEPTGVGTNKTPVATSAPDPAPAAVPTEAESVAANFLAAYAAYDADAAASLLAADADLSGLWNPAADWRLELQYMQATGLRLMVSGCEEQDSSSANVLVRCPFDYQWLGSSELGLGPYTGSYVDLTVRDGKIASTSIRFEYIQNDFSPEMWDPLLRWVFTAHPADAAAMYGSESEERANTARITPDSIPLWEQRTREYVQVAQSPYVAEATQICQAATNRLVGSSDGAGADTERAARLAEQSLAELRSLPRPEGDAAIASWVDQLIARSGQYIDVLNQIATFEAAAVPQELVARRVSLAVELDSIVPGITGCPVRLT